MGVKKNGILVFGFWNDKQPGEQPNIIHLGKLGEKPKPWNEMQHFYGLCGSENCNSLKEGRLNIRMTTLADTWRKQTEERAKICPNCWQSLILMHFGFLFDITVNNDPIIHVKKESEPSQFGVVINHTFCGSKFNEWKDPAVTRSLTRLHGQIKDNPIAICERCKEQASALLKFDLAAHFPYRA